MKHTPMHCIVLLRTSVYAIQVRCEVHKRATGTARAMGRPRCMKEEGKEELKTSGGFEHALSLFVSNRLGARVCFGGLQLD